ncbi:hypothetical protein [Streptomyces sp. NBC_00576]|uniref:hypothetical protein n=1 Tax=Streptomyces sp. NBC_00576 TaxID=2903665 RepID=UPI002E81DD7B|nr:hypothetical protein [Streptomyces sp. NBC_00576]WUB73494.1 ATP-binding protein [Streptomyces sp. NBC_00576]
MRLVIEEHERFQHPPQRFAKSWQELAASAPEGGTQIMYATHSPIVVDRAAIRCAIGAER